MRSLKPAWKLYTPPSKAKPDLGPLSTKTLVAKLGIRVPRQLQERKPRRLYRHQAAIRAGREPGRPGRPITSTHPRAEYWREFKRNKRALKCKT